MIALYVINKARCDFTKSMTADHSRVKFSMGTRTLVAVRVVTLPPTGRLLAQTVAEYWLQIDMIKNISNITTSSNNYEIIYIYIFIIYQCCVYRTNIRHIPPEVAWECDTTSVIRRV